MDRSTKIEALAGDFDIENVGWANEKELAQESFKAGILAGVRLRDEELLAMEFHLTSAVEYWKKHYVSDMKIFVCGARWQHEQFMKLLKGDG